MRFKRMPKPGDKFKIKYADGSRRIGIINWIEYGYTIIEEGGGNVVKKGKKVKGEKVVRKKAR